MGRVYRIRFIWIVMKRYSKISQDFIPKEVIRIFMDLQKI